MVCSAAQKKKARVIRLDYYTMPASAGTGTFLDSEEAIDIFVPECAEAEEGIKKSFLPGEAERKKKRSRMKVAKATERLLYLLDCSD